jgi:hypothetical protein
MYCLYPFPLPPLFVSFVSYFLHLFFPSFLQASAKSEASSSSSSDDGSGRGALLDQIRKGMKLRKTKDGDKGDGKPKEGPKEKKAQKAKAESVSLWFSPSFSFFPLSSDFLVDSFRSLVLSFPRSLFCCSQMDFMSALRARLQERHNVISGKSDRDEKKMPTPVRTNSLALPKLVCLLFLFCVVFGVVLLVNLLILLSFSEKDGR